MEGVGGGDQEQRLVDPGGEVLQVRRRSVVGGDRDRGGLDGRHRRAERVLRQRAVALLIHVLGEGAPPGTLGHHGGELVGLGGGLDHHLAADGEADAADPLGVDVGPALEVVDRGLDVRVAAPAPGVGLALAATLAATVEEQHAVAVPGEHPRRPLRAVAAGERDHRGAVLRRDVPALELEPVAGRELHVLVGDAEPVRRDDGAADVRGPVADRGSDDERRHEQRADRAEQHPSAGTTPQRTVGAARAPQRHRAEAQEQQAGRDRRKAGEVVTRGTDLPRVVEALDAGGDAEHAEHQGERAATTAAQARIRPGGETEQRERDEAADEVVACRRPRLRLQVVVVDHVQRDQRGRDPEQQRLSCPSAGPGSAREGAGKRRKGHRASFPSGGSAGHPVRLWTGGRCARARGAAGWGSAGTAGYAAGSMFWLIENRLVGS